MSLQLHVLFVWHKKTLHKLQSIRREEAQSFSTLASFQAARPTPNIYHYSQAIHFSCSASFYFNESTINKEMDQLPKWGWFLHNGCLLLSMAVLNSSSRPLGHVEAISGIAAPTLHTPFPPEFDPPLLLSSRSHGLTVPVYHFIPHAPPLPFALASNPKLPNS